jgi:hypothetical protein
LKALLPGTDDTARFVCNSPELYAAFPVAARFFFNSREDPDRLGLRVGPRIADHSRLAAGRTLLRHDELFLSSFHRTEAFNVATRPLGWWRTTIVFPQDEDGNVCGFFPIWRGVDQKDFSGADYSFLRACAPHIAHGLRTAQLIEHRGSIGITDFVPSALWSSGIVIMDSAGKIILMDDPAAQRFRDAG